MNPNLTYQHHLDISQSWVPEEHRPTHLLSIFEAQKIHARVVASSLIDTADRVMVVLHTLRTKDAHHYFRFGLLQRLMMIYRAFCRILDSTPPDREEPLAQEETDQTAADLNSIYINLRGALDNVAVTILHEAHFGTLNVFDENLATLFWKTTLAVIPEPFKTDLLQHRAWNKELKDRRDPVAHRIPLSVPPAIISKSYGDEYHKLNESLWQLAGSGEFETAFTRLNEIERLGRFIPFFLHHPKDGYVALYPTVATDLAHMLAIVNIVNNFLTETNKSDQGIKSQRAD